MPFADTKILQDITTKKVTTVSTFFVDFDRETRIQKDAAERGYDMDDVQYRYKHHVMPAFNEFIEPYKEKADFVIKNIGDEYKTGLTSSIQEIKRILAK